MKIRICHISDSHGKHNQLEIPECDILIHSGDISPLGELHSVDNFLKWFIRQTQATYRVFIAGNHDRGFDPKFTTSLIYDKLQELLAMHQFNENHTNNVYLENTSVEIMGVKIWGSPITPWFHGDRWAFNKHRGAEIAEIWQNIPINTDIVVTHGPVRYKCDKLFRDPADRNDPDDALIMDGYAGCEDLGKRLKVVKPLLHLSGHIHEGYGYEYDADTHYFNSSNCNLMYLVTNKPQVIEADFQEREITVL